MPNFSVFNMDPNQLKATIYGSDGTSVLPINTDSTGRINIGDVNTVTAVLGATITGGTLNAVEAVTIVGGTVSATITGGTIDAVTAATIVGGTLNAVEAVTIVGGTITTISENHFNEFAAPGFALSSTTSTPIPAGVLTQDTYPYRVYSYVVYNDAGAITVNAFLEISADGTRWITDQTITAVTAAGAVITPIHYAKYTRVSLALATAGAATVDVYLDAQV